MRKIILFTLIFSAVIMMTSCNKELTAFEKQVQYLNKKEVSFYQFNNESELKNIFFSYNSFDSISEISDIDKYSILLIDANLSYQNLTTDFLDELYNLLESNQTIAIMFINAPDYEFFRNTSFSQGSNNYEDTSYINLYYNFDEYSGISNRQSDYSIEPIENKFKQSVVDLSYRIIVAYEGSL